MILPGARVRARGRCRPDGATGGGRDGRSGRMEATGRSRTSTAAAAGSRLAP